jgi:hypothetical protein
VFGPVFLCYLFFGIDVLLCLARFLGGSFGLCFGLVLADQRGVLMFWFLGLAEANLVAGRVAQSALPIEPSLCSSDADDTPTMLFLFFIMPLVAILLVIDFFDFAWTASSLPSDCSFLGLFDAYGEGLGGGS